MPPVYGKRLQDDLNRPLPPTAPALGILKRLELHSMNLTGLDPALMGALIHLTRLTLGDNYFVHVPAAILEAPSLQVHSSEYRRRLMVAGASLVAALAMVEMKGVRAGQELGGPDGNERRERGGWEGGRGV